MRSDTQGFECSIRPFPCGIHLDEDIALAESVFDPDNGDVGILPSGLGGHDERGDAEFRHPAILNDRVVHERSEVDFAIVPTGRGVPEPQVGAFHMDLKGIGVTGRPRVAKHEIEDDRDKEGPQNQRKEFAQESERQVLAPDHRRFHLVQGMDEAENARQKNDGDDPEPEPLGAQISPERGSVHGDFEMVWMGVVHGGGLSLVWFAFVLRTVPAVAARP